MSGRDEHRVARFTESRGQGDAELGRRVASIDTGQDPDRQAAGRGRPARRGAHHAGVAAAAEQHPSTLGRETSDARRIVHGLCRRALAGTDDRDADPAQ